MQKPKLNIDRPVISDDRINSLKDFDKLHTEYTNLNQGASVSPPKRFTTKFWFGSSLSFLAVSVITYILLINKTEAVHDIEVIPTNETTLASETRYESPFDDIQIEYETYTISNKCDTIIETKTGSKIHIPQHAFNHLNGDKLMHEVEIKYREFHTPVDIFLSGIPMVYDSAGVEFTFESAGMLEIRGFSNGEELIIKENTPLKVEMVSQSDDPKHNLYKLDDSSGEWENIGKDKITPLQHQHIVEEPIHQKHAPTEEDQIQWIKPQILDKQNFAFTIEIDSSEFPELVIFEEVLFEINNDQCEFDDQLYSVIWEKIQLQRNELPNNYTVNLCRPDTTLEIIAYPVVKKEQYDDALQAYKEKTAKNENKRNSRQLDKNNGFDNASEVSRASIQVTDNFVARRTFIVPSFGTFNVDAPIAVPTMIANTVIGAGSVVAAGIDRVAKSFTHEKIKINLVDSKNKRVKQSNINYVNLDRNALFYADANSDFYVKKGAKIVLWVITDDGKIGIVDSEEFSAKTKGSNAPLFTVNLYDRHSGVALLRKLIG